MPGRRSLLRVMAADPSTTIHPAANIRIDFTLDRT
jgi:hypothetical protein